MQMSEASDQLLDLRTIKQNWCHDHPLVFTEEQRNGSEQVDCSMCEEPIQGSSYYCCTDCKFYLHKICADLPLKIDHPFYHRHALYLQKKPPGSLYYYFCDSCYDQCEIYYCCSSCDYGIDVKCALLPQFIAGDFSKLHHSSHAHPLIFTTKKKAVAKIYPCAACEETTPGLIYSCADCKFYIHKKCAELPPKITHSSHRKHPLVLLTNAPPHQEKCSCHLCKNHIKGFIYHCSLCKFDLKIKHIFSSQIEIGSHEHPFNLVSKPMSFVCDACGTAGDCIPYLCTTCNLAVHKDCISLPKVMKISRHVHPISHIYFLLENECERTWDCRICYNEVNVEYGCYYCSDCNYIVHVNCAMYRNWLEVIVEDQTQNETLILSLNDSMTSAEDVTATEIKHFSHQHNLQLSEEMKSDTYCDGCMRAISGPFYFCKQCDFFVHTSCAKLPMKTRYWHSPCLLVLFPYGIFKCFLCKFHSSGFSYYIEEIKRRFCLRCFSLSDTLEHQGHVHSLFCDFKYKGNCSACGDTMSFGYRCKYCNFALDWSCISLPQTTRQKYDKHPLTLTYHDGDDTSQYYCDICEEKRDPSYWFYRCPECNFTAHPKCTLGQYPFIKRGRKFRHKDNPHSLISVQNVYYYPLCEECDEPCLDLAVECEEPECTYISHFKCLQFTISDFFPIQDC